MFQLARIARIARIELVARGFIALGLLGAAVGTASACSASSSPVAGGAGGPDSGPGTTVGDGGGPGVEGGPAVDGGGGGDVPSAIILVTQTQTASGVAVSVVAELFASASILGCTSTPVAGCFAGTCPMVDNLPPRSSLNGGTLTVTGTGVASPAMLTYGQPTPGVGVYSSVKAQTKFYNGGDALSVSGAGGAELPSFAAQTVVAPNDIVLTAPACGTSLAPAPCPDVDRSKDATVTWTGGGAGKVSVTYITDTDSATKTLTCFFDALAGTGTIPSAGLMTLDPPSAPGFSGKVFIYPMGLKTFMVGTLLTAFEVQGTSHSGTFTTR